MSLLLLDTASLYFRAFYGVPDSLSSPRGEPVNAIRGLLDMIAFLVTEHRPTRLVACWDDDWRPAWRVQAIPSYKAHRIAVPGGRPDGGDVEETPEALVPQIPVIAAVLEAFGMARVGAPGYEADDVIGTLVTREIARGEAREPVSIMTGDRDLFQLVDDAAQVRVLYPARGVRDPDVVDEARLAAKYGVPTGDAYADLAVLRGDPSDGLPGVPGIGEKTAAALLARFGSLEGILRVRDSGVGLTPAQKRRLLQAADYLEVAPRVVRVARDAPLPDFDDRLPKEPLAPETLLELTDRWGLRSSVGRVLRALSQQ